MSPQVPKELQPTHIPAGPDLFRMVPVPEPDQDQDRREQQQAETKIGKTIDQGCKPASQTAKGKKAENECIAAVTTGQDIKVGIGQHGL